MMLNDQDIEVNSVAYEIRGDDYEPNMFIQLPLLSGGSYTQEMFVSDADAFAQAVAASAAATYTPTKTMVVTRYYTNQGDMVINPGTVL